MKWRVSILAGLLWASLAAVTAEAGNMKYLLNCYSNDNMSAATFNSWNSYVLLNGRWEPVPTNEWYLGNQVEHTLDDGLYFVNFLRIRDFYVPDIETWTIPPNLGHTNWYHIYSNSLAVAIRGISNPTNFSTNAVWQLAAYPAEYTNSTMFSAYGLTFTNNFTLATIPSGTYSIVFNTVRAHTAPNATNISIGSAAYDWFSTNAYRPYTNSLRVVISGVSGTNVVWSLADYPANFTNALPAGASFTNSQTLSMIPTGAYTITFPAISSYSKPADISTNITGPDAPVVTGLYSQVTGNLRITMTPDAVTSSAPWTITTYPSGYTNGIFGGIGPQTISNVAIGFYRVTFDPVVGYTTPTPGTNNVYSNQLATIIGAYTFAGHQLIVHLGPPFDRQWDLAGLGSGPCRVEYSGASVTQSAALATYAVNDDATVTLSALTNYVYKWYLTAEGQTADSQISSASTFTNSVSFIMTADRAVWLLYSRAYTNYDNAGDIDQDQLPDRWEITWLGNGANSYSTRDSPPQAELSTNTYANGDNDWIPSSGTNPPASILIDSNNIVLYAAATNDSLPGYPLARTRLLTRLTLDAPAGGSELGYAKGNAFHNLLECRGLDGYYLTNGPAGRVANDDPLTDPTKADTDLDGMSDGWEYYFWHWRSANAYSAGISNSANLSWVSLRPTVWNPADNDMDNDGLFDGEEHDDYWTDPTHCDTDGDQMDDYYETDIIAPFAATNALDYMNKWHNPDGDYMALGGTKFLTIGLAGAALSANVCYLGASNSPSAAWLEIYTNTGANRFDLYHDTVIKTDAALTNLVVAGGRYVQTNYFYSGTNLAGSYKSGQPAWVDMDNSGAYSAGDVDLVNPLIKHEAVYLAAPSNPSPGACSFNPLTAWTNSITAGTGTNEATAAAATTPYITYEEYLGGDYIGRLSWDAGGRMSSINDDPLALTRASYSLPSSIDTDSDLIPDGWELYVGLNPNNLADAALDGDGDGLINFEEWANSTHPLANCSGSWSNKFWPTDPGVLIAPSPNDPHPTDTDWDGVSDNGEKGSLNPTSFDTDGDFLPDGWETYAGSLPAVADAGADPDNDGLANQEEYLTGAVSEWMYCDPRWGRHMVTTNFLYNVRFMCRSSMGWDPQAENDGTPFIPPDFLSDPGFQLVNGLSLNVGYLRTNYPAAGALAAGEYHTTLANNQDSDLDGMDDFWEAYHGLNPCRGTISLMIPVGDKANYRLSLIFSGQLVGELDAGNNSDARNFQFGFSGDPFTSLSEFFANVATTNLFLRALALDNMAGPFNCGLSLMDPDADGLPNADEYSYSANRPYYHTDPSPLWRTDMNDTNSFVYANYYWLYSGGLMPITMILVSPFSFESSEGFDTDHDGRGDYSEINSAVGETGNDPLDPRNPIRNRALYLGGNDLAATLATWVILSESYLTRFCVEAWIKPDNVGPTEQVIIERASLAPNPFNQNVWQLSANFKLGITNGLPFIMYNGRGALRAHQATANMRHQIQPGTNWTHVAGVYDGTNLAIYVNGENSATVPTEELPDTGIDILSGEDPLYRTCAVIIGAENTNLLSIIYDLAALRSYFGGCIDEVRVWNGPRTRADIISNMRLRLPASQMTNLPLFVYCTFDDVPDPYHRNSAGALDEPVAPNYLTALDTSMRLHPSIDWWKNSPNRSTIYTGLSNSYNYLVFAQNHAHHTAVIPPYDDFAHVITNASTNATASLPDGYKNPANPYGPQSATYKTPILTDFYLFRGARAVATNSWLSGLSGDPDSTDSDGDGMPDWWEQLYNLDPYDATGNNGAWGDYDNDGLNNRAEYLAGTNPRNSDTYGTGLGDYDSRASPYTRTFGELYMDGDGMPDTWEIQYGLDPYHYDAHLDKDNDGWSNYAEYQAGTNPNDASSYPQPHVLGSADYFGNNSGTFHFYVYNTNTMDGVPAISTTGGGTNAAAFDLTGFKEGDFYLQVTLDANIMGFMEEQPLTLGYSSISNVRVHVKDAAPGYGRFTWTAGAGTGDYPVVINQISAAGSPTVLTRVMRWSRNSFHEWDYQLAGFYGFSVGQYQWWMNAQNGTFSVTWPASMSTPSLIYPRGEQLNYARNLFQWTMDPNSTKYHLQVARQAANGGLAFVLDNYYPTPYADRNGVSQAYLPKYASELGNGIYYWRVASWSPAGESAWPEAQTFEINLSSTNSRWISGEIYYFGKADSSNIIVEAYDNAGFSGKPAARILVNGTSRTNAFKGSFILNGLPEGTYYVRAYLDVTPAGGTRDDKLDKPWESWGFIRDPNNDYQPRALILSGTLFISGAKLVIRDHDTDNDLLPDAWEMFYFGNLDQTGDMDFDGDGETNLEEYMRDGVVLNPAAWDTDGDGLSDAFEINYTAPSFGFSAKSGLQLDPDIWDTDGDRYSDGAEYKRYHTNPLDPTSYPLYRPLCFDAGPSPSDYDGDGRTDLGVYDLNSGNWHIMNAFGQSFDLPFGNAATQPLLGDYDGDGNADFALYEPVSGTWYLYNAWTGQSFRLNFGDSEMTPVPADYDGDGKTDLAVYYPAEGLWYIYSVWTGRLYSFRFGGPGLTPVPGDYNGDGGADLAVYEPSSGNWNIFAFHLYTHEGQYFNGNFGGPTMTPVPGDYDGDGRNDAALYETGAGNWYILTWRGQFVSGQFGGYGCIPAPGDYDGDGRTDVAVYYPPTGAWYIYCWSGQSYQARLGSPAAAPILKGR